MTPWPTTTSYGDAVCTVSRVVIDVLLNECERLVGHLAGIEVVGEHGQVGDLTIEDGGGRP